MNNILPETSNFTYCDFSQAYQPLYPASKKSRHPSFCHKIAKYWLIFQIRSPKHSMENVQ